jgi:hypothetical protein
MKSLLTSPRAPRSILIEVNQANADKVVGQMTAAGYAAVVRHWTSAGQDAIREGADPLKQFPHNVVFDKVTAPVERRPAELSLLQTG